MPHQVEGGMYLRTPAWHRIGNVVGEWPGSWEAACLAAGPALQWEIRTEQVYSPAPDHPGRLPIENQVALYRDDKAGHVVLPDGRMVINPESFLAIQSTSYHVIRNREFGEVIEKVLGDVGSFWHYEALFALNNGRRIVAVLRAKEPLNIGTDPALTFPYVALINQHDGNGGLKGIPSTFRPDCANMIKMADMQARAAQVGFSIKHTAGWGERIELARETFAAARREGEAWAQLATKLGRKTMTKAESKRFMEALLPTNSAMSERQVENTEANRRAIGELLKSPTCRGIEHTVLGHVQAAVEYADHVRPAHSDSTRAARVLTRADPIKQKAFALARVFAN